MRHAVLLGLCGLALVAGIAIEWVHLSALVGAVPLLLIALVYALKACGLSPERFLYLPGIAVVWHLVILPYTLFAGLTLVLSRWVTRESFADEVRERIWVGSAPLLGFGVRSRKIDAVLNLCFEFPGLVRTRDYLRIPMMDAVAPTPGQLRRAVEWVEARHREGRTLLIHCAQGHGRSVTVAAAAMIRLGPDREVDEVLEAIRKVRPGIHVNAQQREAVMQFRPDREGASAA